MAKQSGIIKLKGTIGDISFYKSKDGFLARGKGGVDKTRIQSDPAFQRTRENGSEFGRAGKAGRSLRKAFRPLLLNTADSRVTSRLTQRMVKVIKSDQISARGERNVVNGNLELLNGFDFNFQSPLESTLYASYSATIDRDTGTNVIEVSSFTPKHSLIMPDGATHFRFISAAADVNFEEDSSNLVMSSSEEIPLGAEIVDGITLSNVLNGVGLMPIFLVFGIEFLQEVNGDYYPLKSGSYNSLSIVAIDGVNAVEHIEEIEPNN